MSWAVCHFCANTDSLCPLRLIAEYKTNGVRIAFATKEEYDKQEHHFAGHLERKFIVSPSNEAEIVREWEMFVRVFSSSPSVWREQQWLKEMLIRDEIGDILREERRLVREARVGVAGMEKREKMLLEKKRKRDEIFRVRREEREKMLLEKKRKKDKSLLLTDNESKKAIPAVLPDAEAPTRETSIPDMRAPMPGREASSMRAPIPGMGALTRDTALSGMRIPTGMGAFTGDASLPGMGAFTGDASVPGMGAFTGDASVPGMGAFTGDASVPGMGAFTGDASVPGMGALTEDAPLSGKGVIQEDVFLAYLGGASRGAFRPNIGVPPENASPPDIGVLSDIEASGEVSPPDIYASAELSPPDIYASAELSPPDIHASGELSPSDIHASGELSPSDIHASAELSPPGYIHASAGEEKATHVESQLMLASKNTEEALLPIEHKTEIVTRKRKAKMSLTCHEHLPGSPKRRQPVRRWRVLGHAIVSPEVVTYPDLYSRIANEEHLSLFPHIVEMKTFYDEVNKKPNDVACAVYLAHRSVDWDKLTSSGWSPYLCSITYTNGGVAISALLSACYCLDKARLRTLLEHDVNPLIYRGRPPVQAVWLATYHTTETSHMKGVMAEYILKGEMIALLVRAGAEATIFACEAAACKAYERFCGEMELLADDDRKRLAELAKLAHNSFAVKREADLLAGL